MTASEHTLEGSASQSLGVLRHEADKHAQREQELRVSLCAIIKNIYTILANGAHNPGDLGALTLEYIPGDRMLRFCSDLASWVLISYSERNLVKTHTSMERLPVIREDYGNSLQVETYSLSFATGKLVSVAEVYEGVYQSLVVSKRRLNQARDHTFSRAVIQELQSRGWGLDKEGSYPLTSVEVWGREVDKETVATMIQTYSEWIKDTGTGRRVRLVREGKR